MTNKATTIVFLYSELALYTIACFKKLVVGYDVDLHVVRWPLNREAPFDFAEFDKIHLYERSNFSSNDELLTFVKGLAPKLIVTSGWMDKGYMYCVDNLRDITSVLTMDNQWKGTIKQRLAIGLAPFFLLKKFNFVWVPGERQKSFAAKLGFKESQIKKGFYAADIEVFNSYFNNTWNKKKSNFPKRFLFVGRYVRHKGIYELWDAFIKFVANRDDWELWCVGTGEEYENRIIHPKIKHFGFLQPHEMEEIISNTGVFVLPSHFEPWGVVVQEFAAAGFPIISNYNVGAVDCFVEDSKNGFVVNSNGKEDLLATFNKIGALQTNQLVEMAVYSHKLAQLISPLTWCETLITTLDKKEKVDVRN